MTTDRPWQDVVVCNTASNFLTDALGRELHVLLREQGKEHTTILGKTLAKIKEVAGSDPTKGCIICGAAFGTIIGRPLPCSMESCRQSFMSWSLETRLSPFLRAPEVLDLLLTLLYAHLGQPRPEYPDRVRNMMPGFTDAELITTISSFPKHGQDNAVGSHEDWRLRPESSQGGAAFLAMQ